MNFKNFLRHGSSHHDDSYKHTIKRYAKNQNQECKPRITESKFRRLSKNKLNKSFVCESEFPAPKFKGEIDEKLFSYDAIEKAVKKLLKKRYNGSETLEYQEDDYMYSLVFSKHISTTCSNLYVNLVVEKYEDGDWEEVYNKELFYYDLTNDSWDSFKSYEDEYDSPEEEEKAFEKQYEDIVSNDIAEWIFAGIENL